MNYEEALKRLANHANMPSSDEYSPSESLVYRLWESERTGTTPQIAEAYSDVITCLEVVNKHLNGAQPSASSELPMLLDSSLVYTLAVLLHSGWEYYVRWNRDQRYGPELLRDLALTCWAISCAWCGVLAGDIDSLSEDILLQRQTIPL